MKKILVFCVSLFLLNSVFFADEVIEFSADRMTGITAENADYTKLSGNAKIKTSDMEISADTIELSGKNFRFIKATGNVVGVNSKEKLDFTCFQMDYDRTEKIAVFTGSVHLVDGQNDVVADAQRIEYREQTGIALMQINVKILQKENVCTCAFALYRKQQQLLEMTGNPEVVRGKDTFRAQEITFNLDTEEITLDGRVRGTVTESSGSAGKTDSAGEPKDKPVAGEHQEEDDESSSGDSLKAGEGENIDG